MKRIFILFGLLSLLGVNNPISSMQRPNSPHVNAIKTGKKAQKASNTNIVDLDSKRDKKFVLGVLDKDWEVLIGGTGDLTNKSKDHFKLLTKHRTKILFVGNKRAGIISYNKLGYIYLIYICPDFRGKGYANLLLNFVEKRLVGLGAKHMKLDVFDYNESGLEFFKKAEFKFKKKSGCLITLYKKIDKSNN